MPEGTTASSIALLGAVSGAPGRTHLVEARLDRFFESAEGPYREPGGSLEMVPFQFRMNGGANDGLARKNGLELATVCARARIPLGGLQVGRAPVEVVVRATQALIDAGKLPAGSAADFGDRVRAMQWSYGIGLDCVGYAEQAFATAHGLSREHVFGKADGGLFPSSASVRKVGIAEARAGDLISLGAPKGERWGHNVICRSHVVAASGEAVRARFPALPAVGFEGPIHVYEVDAAWGAGPDGASYGGLHRQTWLFDETSARWGWVEHASTAVGTSVDRFVSTPEPYGHPIAAVYRPR